jgi:hypothetical protein
MLIIDRRPVHNAREIAECCLADVSMGLSCAVMLYFNQMWLANSRLGQAAPWRELL